MKILHRGPPPIIGEPAETTATEDIMATLTIDLPDDLAEEARDAGLFAQPVHNGMA